MSNLRTDIEAERLEKYKAYIEAKRTESALWKIHDLASAKTREARKVYQESLYVDSTDLMELKTDEEVQSKLREIQEKLLAFQDATAEDDRTRDEWGMANHIAYTAKTVWEESVKKRPSEDDLRAYTKARYDFYMYNIKYRALLEKVDKGRRINLCIDETLDQDQNVGCMVSKLDNGYRELLEDEQTLLLMKEEHNRLCYVWNAASRLCNFPQYLNITTEPPDEPVDEPAPRRRIRIKKTKTVGISTE